MVSGETHPGLEREADAKVPLNAEEFLFIKKLIGVVIWFSVSYLESKLYLYKLNKQTVKKHLMEIVTRREVTLAQLPETTLSPDITRWGGICNGSKMCLKNI